MCGRAFPRRPPPIHPTAYSGQRVQRPSERASSLGPPSESQRRYPGPVARLPRITGHRPPSLPAGPAPQTSALHRAAGSARGRSRPRPAPPSPPQGASSTGPQDTFLNSGPAGHRFRVPLRAVFRFRVRGITDVTLKACYLLSSATACCLRLVTTVTGEDRRCGSGPVTPSHLVRSDRSLNRAGALMRPGRPGSSSRGRV